MTRKINDYLQQLEQEKQIKILLACETGSRAWGFPSPDSDYDIRLIYIHSNDWYLSLYEHKDTLGRMLDNNDIDITGWELRKALRLLNKSNAPILERIQSPILYRYDVDFLKGITELAHKQYSRITTIHHYLSMAKKFMAELQETSDYRLKKFFYALRSAVACKWIVEKESLLPIEFIKTYQQLNLAPALVQRIEELITLKANVSESYRHQGEANLFQFIEDCIVEAEINKANLPASSGKKEDLNNFFRQTIRQHDH